MLLNFYLVEEFNYPPGYLITPQWNGGGPNEQASMYCTPHQFGIGSCIGVYFCNGVARHCCHVLQWWVDMELERLIEATCFLSIC